MNPQSPTAVIRKLLKKCSSRRLSRKFDRLIDARFETFPRDKLAVLSTRDLLLVIAQLLRHLCPGEYTRGFALTEASRLLDYVTLKEGGISGAFPTIREGARCGLWRILVGVVERLKEERKHAYIRGLLRLAIDPSNPTQRLAFANALLCEHASLFVAGGPAPEEIANRIEELLLIVAETEDNLSHALAV